MIRIPWLDVRAPWWVIASAYGATVLMVAVAGFELTRRAALNGPERLQGRRERRRYHLSRAEYGYRRHLGIPLTYPENVAGGGKAAEKGDFPAWLGSLQAAGIDAGEIVREES
jgi:hypothetical protein